MNWIEDSIINGKGIKSTVKGLKTIEPKPIKIKGKQYARPFILKSWLSMSELNLQSDMDYMYEKIYSAFKVPKALIGFSNSMNELSINATRSAEALNRYINQTKIGGLR